MRRRTPRPKSLSDRLIAFVTWVFVGTVILVTVLALLLAFAAAAALTKPALKASLLQTWNDPDTWRWLFLAGGVIALLLAVPLLVLLFADLKGWQRGLWGFVLAAVAADKLGVVELKEWVPAPVFAGLFILLILYGIRRVVRDSMDEWWEEKKRAEISGGAGGQARASKNRTLGS